jgi:Ca-activated chloride channel family protein
MNAFAETAWLLALLAIPAIALAGWWVDRRRRRRLATLLDPALHARLLRAPGPRKRALRRALLLGALGLAAVALARPLGGEIETPVTRSGRDVVYVIDVSRSMLAEDVAPTRLDRARTIALDGLRAMRGDRVAVVAFAGSAALKAPLTHDASFTRMAIEELGPRSVARGGTKVGDALRTVLDTLFEEEDAGRSRDVVLITDGEDHDSFPVDAAAALNEHNARLIAIGLGRSSGAPVPAPGGGSLRYEGEPVISRLNSGALDRMARATEGGVFLPVGDGFIEFDEVYRGLASSRERAETESVERTRRAELFQWPLALAFLLLSIERIIRDRS